MRLADWLAREGVTRTAFAERIRVKPSHITGLCNGASYPSMKLAQAIKRETNGAVTPDDWSREEEEIDAD